MKIIVDYVVLYWWLEFEPFIVSAGLVNRSEWSVLLSFIFKTPEAFFVGLLSIIFILSLVAVDL